MEIKADNYTYLTQGAIHKVIVKMALPTIAGMLVIAFYNMADTFFVGQIDTQSTAAVGIVFSVMFFIMAVSFFFGNGSGNYISRELGAQRKANAETIASTGFFYALAAGIVMMLVGEILLTPLSIWLGSTPTILPYTEDYLRIILLGAPLMTCSFTLNNQMRFQGNAFYSMQGIVSGAIVNVILDPILIFGFDMGVRGAAIATVIGQFVSFLVLLSLMRKGGNIPVNLRKVSFSVIYIKEIVAGGTPSLSRQGLSCVATILLNVSAAAFGDAAVAAMSIVNRFCLIVMACVIGFGQGFQPFCGFCYGAGLYRRVKRGFWFSVKTCCVFLLLCCVLGWFFSADIIELFRRDATVIAVGTDALRWQLAALPLAGLTTISNMLMQTIRKPIRANLLASARSGLFFIPLIIVLPRCFGLMGVEMCQAMSDVCSAVITVPIILSAFREMSAEERT